MSNSTSPAYRSPPPSYNNPYGGNYSNNPTVPGMPQSFNPYPNSYSGSGYTAPISTPAYRPPTPSMPPSMGSSGSSFNPSTQYGGSSSPYGVTPGNTPSWVSNPSLPASFSSYNPSNNTSFTLPSFQPLNMTSISHSNSFAVASMPPSSFSGTSFIPQLPALTGRVEWVSPVSTGFRGALPSGNQELTPWTPNASSRTSFPCETLVILPKNTSFHLQTRTSFPSFAGQLDLQKSMRRQFEDTMKIMYQMHASPERPFSPCQPMGATYFAFQINPQTTVFVDPVAVTQCYQRASLAQQWAFQAQLAQMTPRREEADQGDRRISTMQQVNTLTLEVAPIERCVDQVHRSVGNSFMRIIALSNPVPQVFQFPENYSRPLIVGSMDYPKAGIGFINGIDNSLDESIHTAQRISEYAQNAKVHLVYNASHGPLIDVMECAVGHLRITTPPVVMLKDIWSDFIATHGPNEKFLQICHSGGAIHVINALKTSPIEVQQRIIVAAYAPAAIVPEELCYKSFNYVSKRDFVPYLDILGYKKNGDQLVRLEPHPDAPFFDHSAGSPTFVETNNDHIEIYMRGEYE